MSADRPPVLVVADAEGVAETHAGWLADEYDVATVTDAREAVEAARRSVDVVLLDRRTPVGEGALGELRANGREARAAAVTAVDPEGGVGETPFDATLTAPVERDRLLATVERLLALSSYDDAVRTCFTLAEAHAALASAAAPAVAGDEPVAALAAAAHGAREAAVTAVGGFDHETAVAAFAGVTPTGAPVPDW